MRDYIDDKIEEITFEIEKAILQNEPEIIRSTRSMSEGKIVRSSIQSKDGGFDNVEVFYFKICQKI